MSRIQISGASRQGTAIKCRISGGTNLAEECQLSTRKKARWAKHSNATTSSQIRNKAYFSQSWSPESKNLVIAIELSLRIFCKSRCAGSQRSLKNPFRFDSSESSSAPMNWQILADIFVNLNDQQVCKFQTDPKIKHFEYYEILRDDLNGSTHFP